MNSIRSPPRRSCGFLIGLTGDTAPVYDNDGAVRRHSADEIQLQLRSSVDQRRICQTRSAGPGKSAPVPLSLVIKSKSYGASQNKASKRMAFSCNRSSIRPSEVDDDSVASSISSSSSCKGRKSVKLDKNITHNDRKPKTEENRTEPVLLTPVRLKRKPSILNRSPCKSENDLGSFQRRAQMHSTADQRLIKTKSYQASHDKVPAKMAISRNRSSTRPSDVDGDSVASSISSSSSCKGWTSVKVDKNITHNERRRKTEENRTEPVLSTPVRLQRNPSILNRSPCKSENDLGSFQRRAQMNSTISKATSMVFTQETPASRGSAMSSKKMSLRCSSVPACIVCPSLDVGPKKPERQMSDSTFKQHSVSPSMSRQSVDLLPCRPQRQSSFQQPIAVRSISDENLLEAMGKKIEHGVASKRLSRSFSNDDRDNVNLSDLQNDIRNMRLAYEDLKDDEKDNGNLIATRYPRRSRRPNNIEKSCSEDKCLSTLVRNMKPEDENIRVNPLRTKSEVLYYRDPKKTTRKIDREPKMTKRTRSQLKQRVRQNVKGGSDAFIGCILELKTDAAGQPSHELIKASNMERTVDDTYATCFRSHCGSVKEHCEVGSEMTLEQFMIQSKPGYQVTPENSKHMVLDCSTTQDIKSVISPSPLRCGSCESPIHDVIHDVQEKELISPVKFKIEKRNSSADLSPSDVRSFPMDKSSTYVNDGRFFDDVRLDTGLVNLSLEKRLSPCVRRNVSTH